MRYCRRTFLLRLALLICPGHAAYSSEAAPEKQIIRRGSCEGVDLEDGYIVQNSWVTNPFEFLPWVAARERRVAAEISALVDKKPFQYHTAITGALDIIRNEDFLPNTGSLRVRIGLEVVSAENCSKPNVDLVYGIYSTQIIPNLNGAMEARKVETETPQSTAGLAGFDLAALPFHFSPIAAYDSTDKFSGGARIEVGGGRIRNMPFGSLLAEGQASPEMMSFSAGLGGSADMTNLLSHVEWRLKYSTYRLPTGAGDLRQAAVSAQVSGNTRAFSDGSVAFRFGALVEGGNQHGSLRSLRIPTDTATASEFGALKLYAGLDSRLSHQVFSISYGLELGAIHPTAGIDWRKHIVDVRHEFWYPLSDHRLWEVESRLTGGILQIPGRIPLTERFFGGNYEEFFISGDSWQIRTNPVIRAIPGNRLFISGPGAGADRFLSYNLTTAYTVWRKPLVPAELTNDPQFQTLLNGQITTATSVEQVHFTTRDPHFRNLVESLTPLQEDLASLKTGVEAVQSAHPGQFAAQFKACISAINIAASRTRSAASAKDFQQYGLVSALLSVDPHEDRLGRVNRACNQDLNTALGVDATNDSPGVRVDGHRQNMEKEFAEIDKGVAARKAKAEMSFVRRTLDTLFREVNLGSIAPVAVFDVASIGPAAPGDTGLRLGPGGGIRIGLASVVNLTAGYAHNLRAGPGEGSGNVFLTLTFRDLFH